MSPISKAGRPRLRRLKMCLSEQPRYCASRPVVKRSSLPLRPVVPEHSVDCNFMTVIQCFLVVLRPRLVVRRLANDGSLAAFVCRLPHGKGMSVWEPRAFHFPNHLGVTGPVWEPPLSGMGTRMGKPKPVWANVANRRRTIGRMNRMEIL